MKTPYNLIFRPDELLCDEFTRNLPEWCYFQMPFAEHCHHYGLDGMEILSQRRSHQPFYIDLFEIKTDKPIPIRFSIPKRQLFLYFMLEGGFSLTTDGDRPITRTRPNTFALLYYSSGSYQVRARAGHHSSLWIGIDPQWMKNISAGFQNIQSVLEKLKDGRSYLAMYPCRMDRKVQRWLYRVYSYSKNNIGALDGNLRKYISYVLGYYDKALETQTHDLAYQTKTYLDEHYQDSDLSSKFLASRFHVTEPTLRHQFRRAYGSTPHEYYSRLRITHAIALMECNSLSIKDVYPMVGYRDERSFRYALNRFLKKGVRLNFNIKLK
ncbi:AraC family transcriptional regulator [Sinomicrobium weinanense]|uniref:Helix-turn-helix transcriptional regulator n=1 Tax=Sinomicrobium weinanense TaxID=2842200 RepID=A0A926JQY4_9FLAO|nr:AraC family transcriptional regulator [Sinomicrobium weinanense]MBC9795870.1 helix-turn-helix transcriptional regulator [Sinomicrobium weinanense]MBU3125390.1 AraC family transcriptional regulator [Sinomicrobium weinanense]